LGVATNFDKIRQLPLAVNIHHVAIAQAAVLQVQTQLSRNKACINAIERYLESLPSGWKKPRIRRLSNQTEP
jgi:hypothetical protein